MDALWGLLAEDTEAVKTTADPASFAFEAQRPLVVSKSRYDVAILPRQAGKTIAAALRAWLVAQIATARRVTYVTKTRKNGKRLFWYPLLEWASKLGYSKAQIRGMANHGELTLKVPHADGSFCIIEILGAHDQEQVELLRGTQYDLVIVDEAQLIRPLILESLMREVLVPGCRVRKGAILMIGTPGPVKWGPFYDAWASDTWTKFHFTAWDNPYTPPGSLEEEAARLGLKPTDAIYVREYLGQWYDGDDDARVWTYQPGRNDPDIELPTGAADGWKFSWGIDLASANDNDALVVMGWRPEDGERRLYVVDYWEGPGRETIDDLEAVLREKRKRWMPACAVGDDGGHGAKKILNTLAPRLGLKFQPKPVSVEATVRAMNTDLRLGRMKVPRDSALAQDMQMEVWEVSKTGKRTIGGPRHSDLTSSARYAYAASQAFRNPEPKVVETDPRKLREAQIIAYLAGQHNRKTQSRWT